MVLEMRSDEKYLFMLSLTNKAEEGAIEKDNQKNMLLNSTEKEGWIWVTRFLLLVLDISSAVCSGGGHQSCWSEYNWTRRPHHVEIE